MNTANNPYLIASVSAIVSGLTFYTIGFWRAKNKFLPRFLRYEDAKEIGEAFDEYLLDEEKCFGRLEAIRNKLAGSPYAGEAEDLFDALDEFVEFLNDKFEKEEAIQDYSWWSRRAYRRLGSELAYTLERHDKAVKEEKAKESEAKLRKAS